MLLTGPPGSGKTSLAEEVARQLDVRLVPHQLHAWSDADELYVGVDVCAAVAGDAEHVRQPGVLAVATEAAEADPDPSSGIAAVLLLDEIDKASERTEALLLDWLQSGRVPVQPGRHLVTRLERLLVVVTSNGVRPLSEALLRRCRRVEMIPLTGEQMVEIIQQHLPTHSVGVIRLMVRAALEITGAEEGTTSVQEVAHAVEEACDVVIRQS